MAVIMSRRSRSACENHHSHGVSEDPEPQALRSQIDQYCAERCRSDEALRLAMIMMRSAGMHHRAADERVVSVSVAAVSRH